MTGNIGWYHPEDESDQWDGFNEPGIEHFSGSPIRHLAREINQNSLDSHTGKPVKVKMRLIQVDTKSIPGYKELMENFKLCETAAKHESTKAQSFFANALTELSKSKISVLEISDFNTTGIKGPSQNGKPFYAFMKAKGQSKKATDTATGSFGIGKFAPYAVSKLRTVFVSTVFKNDENEGYTQLTQGKSILMSHDDSSTRRQGVGFWGVRTKCQPVVNANDAVPNWIQRLQPGEEISNQCGTKLSILGFNNEDGWETNLAVSVAENFFGAIYNNSLEVEIQGTYLLNKETITSFFENEAVREHISNQKNEPEHFDNCRNYLQALKGSVEVIVEDSEQLHLGLTELRIYLNEGLPKKICFLRNGMFISDDLSLPGLKQFSDFKEFVAVVQCKSTKGNELLRGMEPPRHDDFEPERLASPDLQKKGAKSLKDLAKWVRDMLKRNAKNPVTDITTLDELKDFFADDEGEGTGSGTEDINPTGKIIIRAKPVPIKASSTQQPGNPGDGVSGGEGGEGGGGADGAGGGDGLGGSGSGSGGTGAQAVPNTPQVGISNVRAITTSGTSRKISFTPTKSGELILRILEAGADSDYDVSIAATDLGKVKSGGVQLPITKNERVTVNITLTDSFDGALKVIAYEV